MLFWLITEHKLISANYITSVQGRQKLRAISTPTRTHRNFSVHHQNNSTVVEEIQRTGLGSLTVIRTWILHIRGHSSPSMWKGGSRREDSISFQLPFYRDDPINNKISLLRQIANRLNLVLEGYSAHLSNFINVEELAERFKLPRFINFVDWFKWNEY